MSEKDIDKLKRLAKALDNVVEFGEAVYSDGKIDFSDAAQLPKLYPIVQEIYELWGHKDELVSEAKDLDWAEAQELLGVVK
jgi:hypothetical protein